MKKTYKLDQERAIGLFNTQYGLGVSTQTIEDHNKLHIYGLFFLPGIFDKLCRLGRGVGCRQDLNAPERIIKGMFEVLLHKFNNKNIIVT